MAGFKGHNHGICLKCGKLHGSAIGNKGNTTGNWSGKKLSQSHKNKISQSHIGIKHNNLTKKKLSQQNIGKYNHFYGKKHSVNTREKISKKRLLQSGLNEPHLGHTHSTTAKQIIRDKRAKQIIPTKDTIPEKMIQIALSLENIKFEKHKTIKLSNGSYHQADIFIQPNICLEIDGDYWHSLPKSLVRDQSINYDLTEQGYQVIRIKESSIKDKNKRKLKDNVFNLIRKGILNEQNY